MLCANLEAASLKKSNFEDPAGSTAVMESANLRAADLEGSSMAGVNLRVATLKHANMQNCDLRSAVLAGADLEVSERFLDELILFNVLFTIFFSVLQFIWF